MATDNLNVLNILSTDDNDQIPERLRLIIRTEFKKIDEELFVAKKLVISTKTHYDSQITELNKNLEKISNEQKEDKDLIKNYSEELDELKNRIKASETEVNTLRTNVQRLEDENETLRKQRNSFGDERDDLMKIVQRRDIEIQRYQEDITNLTNQLDAISKTKCEALIKVEECESKQMSLEFKEKRLEQERELFTKQIQSLNNELNEQKSELLMFRKNNTRDKVGLETKLFEKSEELESYKQQMENLKTHNNNLAKTNEDLLNRLKEEHENSLKIKEYFDQEINAQTKVATLYKEMAENSDSKTTELTNAIKELQKLLSDASQQYGDLESKSTSEIEKLKETVNERDNLIKNLRTELTNANDLLKVTTEENLQQTLEGLSPTAAAVSRLVKSGMTLTQIYTEYAKVSEELVLEKNESRNLKLYIETILQEIEEKAPLLKQLNEDFQASQENLRLLAHQLDERDNEAIRLREEHSEAVTKSKQLERDNERCKQEITDMGRQICFLLNEVEVSRAGFTQPPKPSLDNSELHNSSDVISRHLVEFRDIQELQEKNRMLTSLVRELSNKAEMYESKNQQTEKMDTSQEEKIDNLQEEIKELQEKLNRHQKMMESALNQRDMYKRLYEQDSSSVNAQINPASPRTPVNKNKTEFSAMTPSGDMQSLKNELKMTLSKLESAEKSLTQMRTEFDQYRQIRVENEKHLHEQLEKIREECRELTKKNCRLASQNEFSEQQHKILKNNLEAYKKQIASLEEKARVYNEIIIKHESSISLLKEETLASQHKAARQESESHHLKEECSLLRQNESRLLREMENIRRERSSQNILMVNLETIKASIERVNVEGQMRLENRLEESSREYGVLQRKLKEMEQNHNDVIKQINREMKKAKDHLEEEKHLRLQAQQEVQFSRDAIQQRDEQLLSLSAKVRALETQTNAPSTSGTNSQVDTDSQKIIELTQKMKIAQSELESARALLATEKRHSASYNEIATGLETHLKELQGRLDKETKEYAQKLEEQTKISKEYQLRVETLEDTIKKAAAGSALNATELNRQLQETKLKFEETLNNYENLKTAHETSQEMLQSVSEAMQATEDKYNREVILHSQNIQALSTLKEDATKFKDELQKTQEALKTAQADLETGRKGWNELEDLLKKEKEQTLERMKELEAQNDILHDQIEALGAKLSCVHQQNTSADGRDLNVSAETAAVIEDITSSDEKGSKQLLRLVKYLRKEKDISLTKYEMIRAENARLKAQLEMLQQQLDESRETLSKERQTSDSNLLSSTKQAELLRKLETLNAITDSNRVLREERNSLSESIKGMSEQITKLNIELEPLKKRNIEQTTRLESLEAENSALRSEAARLHQNIQSLIERSNKHSPADWRMLNTERETLSRQLNIERDNTNKQREELRVLRGKVNSLEAQLAQSQKQNATVQEELNQLKNELATTKAIVEKSQKDAKAKEDAFNDLRTKELNIRKIARKYKNQYEELTKKVEEDKSRMEAEAAAAVAAATQSMEIPSDKIDQLREEGRREVEVRLKETVERHSDLVKGLNNQVSSSQGETEFLKKENERAKAIVKSARQKIIQLTEVNKNINTKLSETQAKVTTEQDERSQLEARVVQLEKELSESRGERESMQQRIKLLQGMLEKQQQQQQAAKPSTSSGPVSACGGGQSAGGGGPALQTNPDKPAHPNEPPTANIKPIPGPSNSAVKQQQQSVTISRPTRVDTPFASIRPMTIPTRTVAVMPSSQTPSTGVAATSGTQSVQVQPSPSTSAIVTPQQNTVHTTGSSTGERPTSEILAASPTSSINDYVAPSTSASSSSASTGVTVGVSSGTPSTSTSTSQPASHSRTPSVTVHPTKLQQQPVQTMSVPQGSPQPQQSQPQHSQGKQGAESTQEFEPEPMEVSPQQVPTVTQPSTTSGTNVASVVVASASSQPQSSNLGQLTAVAMVMPRMEGQPQEQTIGQTSAPSVAVNLSSESSSEQPQPASSGQAQQEAEQQPGPSAPQPGPSTSVVCSQASSSSSTVTTTQQAAKRARQEEEEGDDSPTSMPGDDEKNPQNKRLRLAPISDMPEPSSRELFSDVEYQVPTSSQRDHEDEVIVLNSGDEGEGEDDDENLADEGLPEEPDDGPEFEDDNDNYDLETYDRDEPEAYDEGPDIDSETDPNNEAENINADSDEVPNPSGSGVQSAGSGGRADGVTEPTSSDNIGPVQGNAGNDDNGEEGNGADNSNVPGPSIAPALSRSRTLTSLSRQQQQLVLPGSYDECTDDSIVPSTPTLYVPRRMDAFGEAVSSPQVPQRRFTFTDAHQQPSHSQSLGGPSETSVHGNVEGSESSEAGSSVGITGSGNSSSLLAGTPLGRTEGMIEDTRMDLSQLEESGTGRSVPSTPLQVSPQGESADGGGREAAQGSIPSITITEVSGNVAAATGTDDDMVDDASPQDLETSPSPDGQAASTEAEAEALEEEQGDGVTSEGEKPVVPSDSSTSDNPNDSEPRTEESREAEAMVEGMMTRSRRGSPQTARRSGGNPRQGPYNRGGRGLSRPTPIIWSEPGSSQQGSGFGGRGGPPGGGNPGGRGTPAPPMMMRGGHMRPGRRMRKPLNLFNNFQRF